MITVITWQKYLPKSQGFFATKYRICYSYKLNSLAPGTCGSNFNSMMFKLIIEKRNFSTPCKIALRWMSQNLTNEKSTLVQVMVWCRQATSHYLSQCWPRSMLQYGVTRPQWVNSSPLSATYMHQGIRSALVQIMAWCLFGAKPLSKWMLTYCQLDP